MGGDRLKPLEEVLEGIAHPMKQVAYRLQVGLKAGKRPGPLRDPINDVIDPGSHVLQRARNPLHDALKWSTLARHILEAVGNACQARNQATSSDSRQMPECARHVTERPNQWPDEIEQALKRWFQHLLDERAHALDDVAKKAKAIRQEAPGNLRQVVQVLGMVADKLHHHPQALLRYRKERRAQVHGKEL